MMKKIVSLFNPEDAKVAAGVHDHHYHDSKTTAEVYVEWDTTRWWVPGYSVRCPACPAEE